LSGAFAPALRGALAPALSGAFAPALSGALAPALSGAFAPARSGAFVVARDETGGTDAAGESPKDSTRISGRSLPCPSLIFAFWASVSLIFTSFDILVYLPLWEP